MIQSKSFAARDLFYGAVTACPDLQAGRLPTANMLSLPHLVVIFLVALVVLGPEKLPEVARVMGKMMAQFRRVTGDFRSQIEGEMRDLERQARMRETEEYERTLAGAVPTP